jgi:hypothetical protein
MKQWKTMCVLAIAVFMAGEARGASINLAALMPAEGRFQTVLDEIRDQAGPGYHIEIIDISKNPSVKTVADRCSSNHVAGLILMDTKAIKEAIEMEKFDGGLKTLPKFVFMTLQAKLTAAALSNAAGITFEVPLYTLVTNFRIISQKDIYKIGIFYRKSFEHSIEESKKLLEKEKIAVSSLCIDCDQNKKTSIDNVLSLMNGSWERMVATDKVDAFVIPADNLIVNPKSLAEFWIGTIKNKHIPVIATIDLLASEKFGAAIFTADPDLTQLGNQAASQIVEHYENNISMDKIGFEPTISIKSTLNTHVAEEIGWKLKSEKLGRISTIIK